tara:strand:+ start:233 stop:595 length:363 start_codon:yes stop_codon:yes gene_type:complete
MKIDKKFLAPFYSFAGFALAWYCFMPNFRYLTRGGVYRSQLVINIGQLINTAKGLHYSITQPKTKKWQMCAINEALGYIDYIYPDREEARKEGRPSTKVSDITLEEYQIMKCGQPPKEGT